MKERTTGKTDEKMDILGMRIEYHGGMKEQGKFRELYLARTYIFH